MVPPQTSIAKSPERYPTFVVSSAREATCDHRARSVTDNAFGYLRRPDSWNLLGRFNVVFETSRGGLVVAITGGVLGVSICSRQNRRSPEMRGKDPRRPFPHPCTTKVG